MRTAFSISLQSCLYKARRRLKALEARAMPLCRECLDEYLEEEEQD
jgi:hypothetical protein